MLAVFLSREPATVLLRRKYVGKHRRPETPAALRTLLIFGVVSLPLGLWLYATIGPEWFAALAAGAAGLTGLYAYVVLTNHRRSSVLQIVGASGLSGSAVLPFLLVGRTPDEQLLLLWGVFALQNTGSVLLVHARIEAIRSRGAETTERPRRRASRAWHLVEAAAMAALLWIQPLLAMALLAPWAVHAFDLLRLTDPRQLAVPLQRIGLRELGLSALFAVLATAALW